MADYLRKKGVLKPSTHCKSRNRDLDATIESSTGKN